MSSCGYAYVGHVPVTLGGEEENGHGPDSGLFNMAGKQRTVYYQKTQTIHQLSNNCLIHKKLSYRREAARCLVLLSILVSR